MFPENYDNKFSELLSKDADINYGGFVFPCRFRLTPGGRYLSVQLQAALPPRSGGSEPFFARWNYGKIFGAHVLAICDPTVYLDENLRLGWYLGTKNENATEGVVAIAERCADLIGLDRNLIVYSGSSGGGFAALQAAAMKNNGKAIAINPQTNLVRHTRGKFLSEYIEKISGCLSLEDAQKHFKNRFNVIDSLRNATNKDYACRVIYVQNINDWHYQLHFLNFAEAFGLNKTAMQSVNGNFMSILYNGASKHGAEPPEVVKLINRDAIPFLLN